MYRIVVGFMAGLLFMAGGCSEELSPDQTTQTVKLSEDKPGTTSAVSTEPATLSPEVRELKDLALFLRPGTVEVEAWDLVVSPRSEALSNKMAASLREHQDWLLEHMKKAIPGEPLPYHPNLGLTKDEYQEFLQLADEVKMQAVATVDLRIRMGEQGELSLSLAGNQPDFNDLKLDLETGLVKTVVGMVRVPSRLEPDAQLNTLGPWTGFRWRLRGGDVESGDGILMDLSIGRLRKSGRPALYYHVKQQSGHSLARNSRYVLVFPLDE